MARRPLAIARIRRAEATNVSLTAFLGLQSIALGSFAIAGSLIGSAGPAISLPIFSGGRLRSKYREAEANYDEAVAQYDDAVVQALRDVADSVVSGTALAQRLDRATAAQVSATRAYEVATNRYRGDLTTYLDVLAAGVAIVHGAYNCYEWMFASDHVETDNAYVDADVAQVTPQLSAPACNYSCPIRKRSASEMISTGPIESNPEDAAVIAARDQIRLDLGRTVMRAPIDGIVSKRQVQDGQRVQAGTMLMTVVPLGHAYVDADFKEVQLARVHPGQKVTLTSDSYVSDVVFTGTVTGFSGGTGSAFALIPAQNATDNWIKVV